MLQSILQNGRLLLITGLLVIYLVLDPAQPFFPKCPVLWLTGWKCPGCGAQRALHQLLHGNLTEAIHLNALFVMACPYLLLGLVLEYTPWGKEYLQIRRTWYGSRAVMVAIGLALIFGLMRNIGGF